MTDVAGTAEKAPIRVAALYQFARFPDAASLRDPLARLCCGLQVKGTLLLAPEGINGTIAGSDAALTEVLDHIRTLPGCADLEVKTSYAQTPPFQRMKVRLKREIVAMGEPDIDPLTDVGHYVAPEDWNALILDPDTIVIDTRNDYEVAIGAFEGAIDPKTHTFRSFPQWFRRERERLLSGPRPRKVAMYCTGGIRCEKSTAFLKSEGVEQVYHLKGGILNYLEKVAPEDSLWRGECFVFDERVSVVHGLAQGTFDMCPDCGRPMGREVRTSPLHQTDVRCAACEAMR